MNIHFPSTPTPHTHNYNVASGAVARGCGNGCTQSSSNYKCSCGTTNPSPSWTYSNVHGCSTHAPHSYTVAQTPQTQAGPCSGACPQTRTVTKCSGCSDVIYGTWTYTGTYNHPCTTHSPHVWSTTVNSYTNDTVMHTAADGSQCKTHIPQYKCNSCAVLNPGTVTQYQWCWDHYTGTKCQLCFNYYVTNGSEIPTTNGNTYGRRDVHATNEHFCSICGRKTTPTAHQGPNDPQCMPGEVFLASSPDPNPNMVGDNFILTATVDVRKSDNNWGKSDSGEQRTKSREQRS